MRRLVLFLTAMSVAALLASGVALAVVIDGTAGNDNIYGSEGPDTLNGLGGNDTIYGRAGTDTIDGGYGADNLEGGIDGDTIEDGPSNDVAVDTIYGNAGDDDITAANDPSSKDVINCGNGYDTVLADTSDEIDEDCEEYIRKLTPAEDALEGPPRPATIRAPPTTPRILPRKPSSKSSR